MPQAIPAGYDSAIPYINIRGAVEAIEFYKKAFGAKDPKELGGSPVCITLYVEDVDAMFAQALAAGATVTGNMTVQDKFYGDRTGSLTDPFGHQWSLMTHKEDVSFEEMQRRSDALFSEGK